MNKENATIDMYLDISANSHRIAPLQIHWIETHSINMLFHRTNDPINLVPSLPTWTPSNTSRLSPANSITPSSPSARFLRATRIRKTCSSCRGCTQSHFADGHGHCDAGIWRRGWVWRHLTPRAGAPGACGSTGSKETVPDPGAHGGFARATHQLDEPR
jgi:hypothetical protein